MKTGKAAGQPRRRGDHQDSAVLTLGIRAHVRNLEKDASSARVNKTRETEKRRHAVEGKTGGEHRAAGKPTGSVGATSVSQSSVYIYPGQKREHAILFRILGVNVGIRAGFFSRLAEEGEILLPPGCRFEVVDVQREADVLTVVVLRMRQREK